MAHSDFAGDSYAPSDRVGLREEWPLLVALPALCAAIVLAVPQVGWWALVLAGAVYAMGYRSIVTAGAADAPYVELVVSLGRLGEMNGAVSAAPPTAELAPGMGRPLDRGHQLAGSVLHGGAALAVDAVAE